MSFVTLTKVHETYHEFSQQLRKNQVGNYEKMNFIIDLSFGLQNYLSGSMGFQKSWNDGNNAGISINASGLDHYIIV